MHSAHMSLYDDLAIKNVIKTPKKDRKTHLNSPEFAKDCGWPAALTNLKKARLPVQQVPARKQTPAICSGSNPCGFLSLVPPCLEKVLKTL